MNASPWTTIVNRVVLLNTKWAYWNQMFGTKATVDLLNGTAPSCFALLQESLLGDIITSITRLLDPKISSGQKNVVVESLLDEPMAAQDRVALTGALDGSKRNSGVFRAIRNKILSHEDQGVATGGVAVALADTVMITGAITDINQLMTQLASALSQLPVRFGPADLHGSGDTVCWVLEEGRKAMVIARSSSAGFSSVPDTSQVNVVYVRYPA